MLRLLCFLRFAREACFGLRRLAMRLVGRLSRSPLLGAPPLVQRDVLVRLVHESLALTIQCIVLIMVVVLVFTQELRWDGLPAVLAKITTVHRAPLGHRARFRRAAGRCGRLAGHMATQARGILDGHLPDGIAGLT